MQIPSVASVRFSKINNDKTNVCATRSSSPAFGFGLDKTDPTEVAKKFKALVYLRKVAPDISEKIGILILRCTSTASDLGAKSKRDQYLDFAVITAEELGFKG